jgi:phosphatidylglycerol:prolipoprotein diacylglycerol transferase
MSLVWLVPRRAGVVSAVFLAGYGVLRYSTEQFREPDSRVIALGLTLPMILSITMVAVSAVFLVLSRKAQPIGGLVRTVARG